MTDLTLLILVFIVGIIIGAAVAWFYLLMPRLKKINESLAVEQKARETLLIESTKNAEKLESLNSLEARFKETFKVLSAEVLNSNSETFLQLAKLQLEKYQEGAKHDLEVRQKSIDQLVKPITESLANVDKKVHELDKARTATDATLTEQVNNLVNVHTNLQRETQNLVRALRKPSVRGRWGEIQLQRVVEMAGMVDHCDFYQQESVDSDDGRLRPDMIIRLPGQKTIVLDSKTPLEAYLNSIETTDDTVHLTQLKEHARQVRTHLQKLSEKAYWSQFDQSPEFVILFLPGEMFFSAALQQDPELIEVGASKKVIIATPTTLIALLRAVSYGWTQERLSKNAEEISNLGKKLYSSIRVFAGHMDTLRNSLKKAVESHNKAIGSLETTVLSPARTLKNLAVSSDDVIDIMEPIETVPRVMQSGELLVPQVTVEGEVSLG